MKLRAKGTFNSDQHFYNVLQGLETGYNIHIYNYNFNENKSIGLYDMEVFEEDTTNLFQCLINNGLTLEDR